MSAAAAGSGGGEENGAIRGSGDQRAAKRRRTLGGDAAIAADVDWAAPVSYIHIQLAAGAASPPLRLASRRPRAVVAAAMRAGYALTHVGAVRTATAASTKLAFEPAADAARGAAIDESDLEEALPFAYSASLAQCLTISVSGGGGGGAPAAAGLVVESLVAPQELALIASEHARVTVVQSSPTAAGGVSLVARDSARIAGIGARFARANIRVRGDAAVDGVRGVQQHIYDGPPPAAAPPPPASRRAAARRIVVRSAVFVDSDSDDDDDDYSSGSDDYGGGDSSSDEAVNRLYEAHQQQRGRRQRGAAYVVPERDALLDDAPAADGEDECVICMDRAARARLAPCAHTMCVPCAHEHRKFGKSECPFCRARITLVVRAAGAAPASCSAPSACSSSSSAAAAEASSSNKRKSSEISV